MIKEGKLVLEHGKSEAHINLLTLVAQERGCNCRPYVDWFTYNDWQDLGFQVQKGEKGTKLTRFIEYEDKDGKTHKRPKGYSVFCRCQVKEKE